MARGEDTTTSDLDITVLIDGQPAPYRESLTYAGWLVETFVHTEQSVEHDIAKDVERRRKTMSSLLVEDLLLDQKARAHVLRLRRYRRSQTARER